MGLRLHKEDFIVIFHYMGDLLTLFALPMAIPLVVAIVCQETAAICDFIFCIGITLTIASLMRMFTREHGPLTSKRAMLLVGLVWIAGMLLGALPLYLSGHYASYLDSTLETISGLTTTGFTLTQDVDHMAISVNMWRFLLEFIGGQGVLVAAISLGIFGKGSTASVALYNSEGRSDHILTTVGDTTRFIWIMGSLSVALITIVLASILWYQNGQPALSLMQGFWLAVSSFDTGGFVPYSSSIMFYHSWPLEAVLAAASLVGAINFVIYADINRGDRWEMFKNSEVRTLFIWITLMFLLGLSSLAVVGSFTSFPALVRRGLFTFLTAETTTGFSVLTGSQMTVLVSSGALFAIILAMAVGGCSGSTAGGIKAMRVMVMFKSLVHHVKIALLPDNALSDAKYHHVRRQSLNPDLVSMAFTISLLYIVTYALGSVLGIIAGYGAVPSIFESVSAASNSGLSAGVLTVATPAFLKVFYILAMAAGRLEFMTLLALITALIATALPKRTIARSRARKVRVRGSRDA